MGKDTIEIAGRKIGPAHPPYIIAEISANHNGNLDKALELMTAAAATGADAIKLQTYTPDTITIDHDGPDFQIKGGLWNGYNLYSLYKEAYTPFEWHPTLFEHARKLGVHVFSTPFDDSAVDLLAGLSTPAFKIASFEAIDLPLIRRAARVGKPMIISTGMADIAEIGAAVEAARGEGCAELVLLHCVSSYPAPADQYNLRTIRDLAERFGVIAGLSDHTLGTVVAATSVAMGACVIEKHFTLRRADVGPDSEFSLEPAEFTRLVEDARTAFSALGQVNYERVSAEKANVQFRRSLYIVEDIKAGEPFTSDNVRSIRPGFGMPPDDIGKFVGKRARRDLKRGEATEPTMIDG